MSEQSFPDEYWARDWDGKLEYVTDQREKLAALGAENAELRAEVTCQQVTIQRLTGEREAATRRLLDYEPADGCGRLSVRGDVSPVETLSARVLRESVCEAHTPDGTDPRRLCPYCSAVRERELREIAEKKASHATTKWDLGLSANRKLRQEIVRLTQDIAERDALAAKLEAVTGERDAYRESRSVVEEENRKLRDESDKHIKYLIRQTSVLLSRALEAEKERDTLAKQLAEAREALRTAQQLIVSGDPEYASEVIDTALAPH